jgi:hypothetical protein
LTVAGEHQAGNSVKINPPGAGALEATRQTRIADPAKPEDYKQRAITDNLRLHHYSARKPVGWPVIHRDRSQGGAAHMWLDMALVQVVVRAGNGRQNCVPIGHPGGFVTEGLNEVSDGWRGTVAVIGKISLVQPRGLRLVRAYAVRLGDVLMSGTWPSRPTCCSCSRYPRPSPPTRASTSGTTSARGNTTSAPGSGANWWPAQPAASAGLPGHFPSEPSLLEVAIRHAPATSSGSAEYGGRPG